MIMFLLIVVFFGVIIVALFQVIKTSLDVPHGDEPSSKDSWRENLPVYDGYGSLLRSIRVYENLGTKTYLVQGLAYNRCAGAWAGWRYLDSHKDILWYAGGMDCRQQLARGDRPMGQDV